jgi:hypothetical protein
MVDRIGLLSGRLDLAFRPDAKSIKQHPSNHSVAKDKGRPYVGEITLSKEMAQPADD